MRWIVFGLFAALAMAQGTNPKPAPTDYDLHGQSGSLDIGAEYMVHSYSAGEQMFLIQNYLVVEVALYPLMKNDPVQVELGKFSLRVNHKTTLAPDTAEHAAASLKRSPWDAPRTRGMSGGIGLGGIGIPIGQPRPGPVPGSPDDRRPPAPPRAPDADPPGGIDRTPVNPEEILLQTALPDGTHKGAVSGFIFFPYNGKSSSIKSLELEYGSATLKLK
jgi:hypothetical protein